MAREVREGQTEGGLPYLSFGEGPLLVVFPGLGMTDANPSGIQRWGEMRLLAPLARTFTVRRMSRRVGLAYGTTMEDLANDYAIALDEEFGEPVDVLGIPSAPHNLRRPRARGHHRQPALWQRRRRLSTGGSNSTRVDLQRVVDSRFRGDRPRGNVRYGRGRGVSQEP
jgi:hypothetical protein